MQTSYERVKRALYFQKPDRLPARFSAFGHDDFHGVGWKQIATGDPRQPTSVDEWGCTWSRTEVKNMGLVTKHPLEDWDSLEDFKWLDPDDEALYADMDWQFEGSEGKYVYTSIFGLLFERMHHLHGFENTLMDLYLEREKLEYLADRIVDTQVRIIQNISRRFPGKIHGFEFTEDWGTETAAFISCELFEDFFVPRYKRIFGACKEAGWDIWMHSCGKINALIPQLIECGVNALNMFQPVTNGIEEIGREFAGKVCFYTCCDIQKTLVTGSMEQIRQEAKMLIDHWGTENGGFILVDYGNHEEIGSTPEKSRVMYDAFMRYDRWKDQLESYSK